MGDSIKKLGPTGSQESEEEDEIASSGRETIIFQREPDATGLPSQAEIKQALKKAMTPAEEPKHPRSPEMVRLIKAFHQRIGKEKDFSEAINRLVQLGKKHYLDEKKLFKLDEPFAHPFELKDLLDIVEPEEMRLLVYTPAAYLNESLFLAIINKKYMVMRDLLGDKNDVQVRVYLDKTNNIGAGGTGKVLDGYYVVWKEKGILNPGPALNKAAVKIDSMVESPIDRKLVQESREREIKTLREVRNLHAADQEGLLKTLYAGEIVVENGETMNDKKYVTLTEKLEPREGYAHNDLMEIMEKEKPSEVFIALFKALRGLDVIHKKLGRIHFDMKENNIFVGKSSRDNAVLGDLSTFHPDDLSNIELRKVRLSKPETRARDGVEITECTLPFYKNGEFFGYSVPCTATYADHAAPHIRAFLAWKGMHEGKKIPTAVLALPDMGQIAAMLHSYQRQLEHDNSALPPKHRSTIKELLASVIERLDNVPDVHQLNLQLIAAHEEQQAVEKKAHATNQEKNMAKMKKIKAAEALAIAFRKIENGPTAAEIASEMLNLATMSSVENEVKTQYQNIS